MSKRSDRHEADRLARKKAYQELRQSRAVAEAPCDAIKEIDAIEDIEANSSAAAPRPDLLARAQAFFSQTPPQPAAEPEPPIQATAAQIAANRENAQLSTGPITLIGKAKSSQNRRTHGLAGKFIPLAHEDEADYRALARSIYAEHNPQTDTEQRLADSMVQSYWLTQRAIHFQQRLMLEAADPLDVDPKKLNLFVRYQTTHERSYYKAMKELHNLQKQKAKEQIGFESQQAQIRLQHARAMHLEVDAACRKVMEAPLPGNTTLSFEELTKACSQAIASVVREKEEKFTAGR